jgi:hypothetical protein
LKLQKVLQDTVVYSSGGGIVYDNSCNTFWRFKLIEKAKWWFLEVNKAKKKFGSE